MANRSTPMMLEPEDMQSGMFCTVYETPTDDVLPNDVSPFFPAPPHRGDSFRGMPLCIMAVSLPYVQFRVPGGMTLLDTREITFCLLEDGYLKVFDEFIKLAAGSEQQVDPLHELVRKALGKAEGK